MPVGGRISLRRTSLTSESVGYDAELDVGEERFESQVSVQLSDGTVVFSDWAPRPPPDWLADSTRAIVRSEWRSRAWPRRITRWRAAKDP